MSSLLFWKEWVKEYRYIWYAAAFLFLISLIFLWYGYFRGPDGVTNWKTLQEQKTLNINVHTFKLGPFEINIPGESYVIFEHFTATSLQPDTTSSYIFLVIFATSFVMLISVISTLEKFWYFFGMTLLILLLISLRFEVLGLFGSHHLVTSAAVIVLFSIPSIYFGLFRTTTPFVIRVGVFTAVTVALAICVGFFSTVAYPFYHIYLTSLTGSLVIAVLFIILIGHEIMAGFVYMVGQGSSKSLQHLLLISVVYLFNIFVTALHELRVIQWDFIYINAYLLLSISAIIGIWGYRNREVLYANIFPFYPFGALLFLSLGAICFATTAHLLANVNDPGLKILREGIIFIHAGYGLMFVLYLLSNFGDLLAENRPAYKVLYTPRRMPYFSYRLAGLIATLAFVVYANWRDYLYHGMAAFYNIAGDLHTMMDNRAYAESFYMQGYRQGFQNYRSNYMLANIKASRLSIKDAHYYYKLANEKGPTEYSLVNAGNLHLWTNENFPAIRAYRNGLEILPGSSYLANNIGVGYARVHNVDSSAYFLNQARQETKTRNTAEMNFFALAATEYIALKTDSLLRSFKTESPGTICNALAVATVFGSPFNYAVDPLLHQKLDLYTATLLNNYIIHNAKSVDSVFISKAYRIASDPDNASYSEALKSSLAFAYYHEGNISKALEVLAEQVFLSQTYQGQFNYIMGLWALEQNNPQLASTFFTYADTYDFKDARFYNAIALTESGRVREALVAWDTAAAHGDGPQKLIASRVKEILTLPPAQSLSLPDPEKYQFCRYRIGLSDSLLFNKLSNSFSNPNYKAQALLDMSRKYFEAGHIVPAIHNYQRIAGLKLTDRQLYDDFRHFELRMLSSRGEIRELASLINKGITFGPERNLEKIYYSALINEANADTVEAERNYSILARYNPYFEDGILAAFHFFKNKTGDRFHPYSILANAVQVNTNSLRLLRVYRDEAMRVGLTEYAFSTDERIQELEQNSSR